MPLAFADIGLPEEERQELARKIHSTPRTTISMGLPEFPSIKWTCTDNISSHATLVISNSWLLFDILKLDGPQVRLYEMNLHNIDFSRTGC